MNSLTFLLGNLFIQNQIDGLNLLFEEGIEFAGFAEDLFFESAVLVKRRNLEGIEEGGVVARHNIQAQLPEQVLGIGHHTVEVEEDGGDIILDHPPIVLGHCGIEEVQLALVISRIPETAVFSAIGRPRFSGLLIIADRDNHFANSGSVGFLGNNLFDLG